jgi:hypothetical protein
VEKIKETMCTTYERKIGGLRARTEGRTPIQISVSVESTTPCATNTPEKIPAFRQSNFNGIKTIGNASKKGEETRRVNSRSNNRISTPRGGSSSTKFKMAGHDPTIILPKF